MSELGDILPPSLQTFFDRLLVGFRCQLQKTTISKFITSRISQTQIKVSIVRCSLKARRRAREARECRSDQSRSNS